jgi:DeoR/GlpR family transcriptional regulator of sugar metabolism
MSFEEQTERIETLIWLIKSNNTGTSQNLAHRLGVSRRTVFNDLDFLKGKGYFISYSHTADSYMFTCKQNNSSLF